MTISEAYSKYVKLAKAKDILSMDVRRLLVHTEGLRDQLDVITEGRREMKNLPAFEDGMKRLLNDEPVEYVTGEAEFLTRKLKVDRRVLIPRLETEELVADFSERIGDYFNPRNILAVADIGTGSGCIAIAVKESFPNFFVYASDVSKEAMDVARENFRESGLDITPLEGDALEPFIKSGRKLDVIISNPPYITDGEYIQNSVISYEPKGALLFRESDNVYEKILSHLNDVKKGPIVLFFEISPELVSYLTKLMDKYLKDYSYEFLEDSNQFIRFLIIDVN